MTIIYVRRPLRVFQSAILPYTSNPRGLPQLNSLNNADQAPPFAPSDFRCPWVSPCGANPVTEQRCKMSMLTKAINHILALLLETA